ncbi:MAG: hypothetical protein EPN17_11425 [Methylobacter sp.]|nr:MAG: hypothetical protein EPN17_11425 [Methylobacter sp.]
MRSEPEKESTHNVISVDMDDRAFLFPETKNIAQIKFSAQPSGVVLIEFVYAHNVSRLPPSKVTLQYDDAKSLCLRLIDAVYRAQTQNSISESAHIAITMVTNGYIFIIEENGIQRQFYMGSSVIWRVCNALCRIVDMQSPVLSH